MDDVAAPRRTPGLARGALTVLSRPAVRAVLVLALAAAVFVGTPWRDQSLSGDAVVYAQIGAEVVERGDPTRLTFDGRLAPNKPPFVFWLLAATYAVFGTSDPAACLPSLLAGLATVLLLMRLVARHNGRRAAFWAGLSCATWAVFQRTAHTCRLDTTLAFFTLASVGTFLGITRDGFARLPALGLGALLGLAILTKGPAGLIPIGAIALGAAFAGRLRLLGRTAPWALLALAAVAVPWYALQVVREGPVWWSRLRGDWGRTSAPVQGVVPAIRFYLTDVFLPGLPWVPPLVLGTALAVRRLRRGRHVAPVESLLLAWIVCFLAVLPFLRMHYSRYFAQVVPAFAWLGGVWLAPALRHLARVPGLGRAPPAHRIAAAGIAAALLLGYPAYLFAMRDETKGRYEDLGAAVRLLGEVAPGATTLPTWTRTLDLGEADSLSAPTVAAGRFYFGTRLVPYREEDPDQPPLVLFLHLKRGPSDAAAFEARHGHAPLLRTDGATVYRTREPGR